MVWQAKSLVDVGAHWAYWSLPVRRKKICLVTALTIASILAVLTLLALDAAIYLLIVLLMALSLAIVLSALS